MSPGPATKPRVLLVDDEELLVKAMARILSRRGFEPVAVTSPQVALERALREDFLAVVTDFAMPEFTGMELAGKLRAAGRTGLILLCTGNEAAFKQLAYVDGVITKPVDFDALVARIRQAAAGS